MNTTNNCQEAKMDPAPSAMAVAAFAILSLAGMRSSDTCKHLLRVQNFVQTLAQHLQPQPRFATVLTDDYIRDLFQWVPLHDLGTTGVPDRILLKPSSLTPSEFEMIKSHTTMALEAIVNAEKTFALPPNQLLILKELVSSHHEKWDGSGYPYGLSGELIPLSARMMAIADVYDALISGRVYRDGMPHDEAVAIIIKGRASHFDPYMVDAFIEIQDQFQVIAQRYPDTEDDMQKKIEYMANAIAENAEF